MSAPFPVLSCEYDDGYFDKDEQGWVAARTSVSSDAQTGVVQLRHSGDRNGLDPYDRLTETRIAQVFPELQLVKLENPRWYFDLEKRRLLNAGTDLVVSRAAASGDWGEPARVIGALALVAQLVRLLGGPALTMPVFPGWPPRSPNQQRYEFTRVEFPLTDGFRLELRMRPAIDAQSANEFVAWLASPYCAASVTVTERSERVISLRGGLEHHPRARAFASSWTAD